MANFSTLTEAAVAWLTSCLRPVEQASNEGGFPVDGVTVKFTWESQDYEVGVRKLTE